MSKQNRPGQPPPQAQVTTSPPQQHPEAPAPPPEGPAPPPAAPAGPAPAEAYPYPNLAQGFDLPPMRPRAQPRRHPEAPNPQARVQQPQTVPPVQQPQQQTVQQVQQQPVQPVQQQVTARRTVQGIGESVGMQTDQLVRASNEIFELMKRDPSKVDPKYVNVLVLQGIVSHADKAERVLETGVELRQELARLRKEVAAFRQADGVGAPEKEATTVRETRRRRRVGRRGNGVALRGRQRGA